MRSRCRRVWLGAWLRLGSGRRGKKRPPPFETQGKRSAAATNSCAGLQVGCIDVGRS